MTNNPIRIFFAAPLDEPFHQAAIQLLQKLQNRRGAENIKWIKPENLHLTLRFIGSTPEEKIPEITEKISMAIKNCPPFQIAVKKIDMFPLTHAHTLGIYFTLSNALAELFNLLEQNVVDCGFTAEKRAFVPHVTLGRIRCETNFSLENLSLTLPTIMSINEIILFRSDSDEAGSVYTLLEKFKL